MSKSLTLIRHAKTRNADQGQSDFDRQLAERGHRDSTTMGAALNNQDWLPDLILSSSAVRARQTAIIISQETGYTEESILYSDDLYLASPTTLIQQLADCDPSCEHLAIIAHNPGISQLVEDLTNSHIGSLPTCGVARIKLDLDDWNHLGRGVGTMVELLTPKGLKN